jgi:hypothetical protein
MHPRNLASSASRGFQELPSRSLGSHAEPRTRSLVARAYRPQNSNGAVMPSAIEAKAAVAPKVPSPIPKMTFFRAFSFNGPAPGAFGKHLNCIRRGFLS